MPKKKKAPEDVAEFDRHAYMREYARDNAKGAAKVQFMLRDAKRLAALEMLTEQEGSRRAAGEAMLDRLVKEMQRRRPEAFKKAVAAARKRLKGLAD